AINPNGCRDEVVLFIADAWGLPIAGDNDDPGPARRRGVRWRDHIRVALLMLTFGFSPFAVRYEITGSPLRAKLAELSERLPQTITDIQLNDDGSLKRVYQQGSRDPLPASGLLWYAHEREGGGWSGRSMIAESYGPWLLKHEMWRTLAQSNRRFGMGVPNVETGPNGTPADVTTAANIASAYRAGDQTGLGLPQGWKFNLTGLTGSVPDTLGFVGYLDAQIATSVLAEILNLDTAQVGNRALGDTIIGLLQMSWRAVADEITDTATGLNVQIVDNNWGEDEPVPGILCTDINRPEVTSEAINALVTCGALTPDLTLENDLRSRFNLPTISEQDRTAAAPTPPAKPAQVPGASVPIVSPNDVPDPNSALAP
ncbi:MAG TPA: hypothetical protein VIU37_10005, partial [Candidatus Limnocylindrales bacterium]